MEPEPNLAEAPTLELIRSGLMAVLVVGLTGTVVELLLLKHTEGFWQLVPLGLMGLAMLVLAGYGLLRNATTLRALQVIMTVFLLSGGVGVVQHYLGNITYEKESNPSLSGSELYKSAVMGSTPTLAPGTMVQLGLIGLMFTFRHPRLAGKKRDDE